MGQQMTGSSFCKRTRGKAVDTRGTGAATIKESQKNRASNLSDGRRFGQKKKNSRGG